MTDLTITTTVTPKMVTWEDVPDGVTSNAPIGKMVFMEEGIALAAVDTGNEQKWIVDCVLPRNFAYRIVRYSITVLCQDKSDIADYDVAMLGALTETPEGGDVTRYFEVTESSIRAYLAATLVVNFDFTTVANNARAFFAPLTPPQDVCIMQTGTGLIRNIWIKTSSSTPPAMVGSVDIELHMYTIAQAKRYAPHVVFPVIKVGS